MEEKKGIGIYPNPSRIILVCSDIFPEGIKLDSSKRIQLFKQFINCGFDYARYGGKYTEDSIIKDFFTFIKGSNLRLLLQGENLLGSEVNVKNFIDTFCKYPYLGAWELCDEPRYYIDSDNDGTVEEDRCILDEWLQKYNVIKSIQNSLPQQDRHLIFMNLCAEESIGWIGHKTYPEYLNEVREKFDPGLWSFDYYPIYEYKGMIKMHPHFFNRLQMFSDISKKSGAPFWSYCRTTEIHYQYKESFAPKPTLASISMCAFSALAHGAQGLVFWTYGERKENKDESYGSAPVDRDCNKTMTWYILKDVIAEIRKYNGVFLGCTFRECLYTGDTIPDGTKRLTGKFGAFNKIVSGKAGVLVSRFLQKPRVFNTDGKLYNDEIVMIVNRDVVNKQNIALELSGEHVVDEVTPSAISPDNGNVLNRTLDPGGYIIFHWRYALT